MFSQCSDIRTFVSPLLFNSVTAGKHPSEATAPNGMIQVWRRAIRKTPPPLLGQAVSMLNFDLPKLIYFDPFSPRHFLMPIFRDYLSIDYTFKATLELRMELMVSLPSCFDFLWIWRDPRGPRLQVTCGNSSMARFLQAYVRRHGRVIHSIDADGSLRENLSNLPFDVLTERLKIIKEIHVSKKPEAAR